MSMPKKKRRMCLTYLSSFTWSLRQNEQLKKNITVYTPRPVFVVIDLALIEEGRYCINSSSDQKD
jgi:hypothetical protein